MKKFIAIILLVLYGAASSGATIHFHYCMGKLKGVALTEETKDRCDNCGMSKAKNNCCKDVHKTINTQKDYHPVAISFISSQLFSLPQAYNIINPPVQTQEKFLQLVSRPPPLTVSLFTLFCTYRI